MRLLKILGITLLALLALLLAAVATINLLPGEQYKNLIGSVVKSATGRDLVIGGNLDLDLGSSFRIAASDIRFSNPEWASRPAMFTGAHLEAEVLLMPLIAGVLDVRLVLESPDLVLEKDAKGRANWRMGGAENTEATEDRGFPQDEGGMPLRPFLREVRLERVKVAFEDAAARQEHRAEFGTILLHSQEDNLVVKAKGQVDGHLLFVEGGMANVALEGAQTSSEFNLTGNLADIVLTASGTLDALSAGADMDLLVEASVPTLAALSAFAGRDLPNQGPLDVTARISGRDGKYRVSDIRAKLDAELLKAAVTGGVDDLSDLSGIDLLVNVDTGRLAEVVALAGVEPPLEVPSALRAEAAIQGGKTLLSVSDFQMEVEDEGMKVVAAGAVEDVMARKGVSSDIAMEAGSLKAFSKYAKVDLPNLGPFHASASVASSGDTFSVSDFKADLMAQGLQAFVEGSLADAIAIKGLNAKTKVSLASLASLNELTGQDLPESGPLELSGELVSGEGLDVASKISATLSGDGVRAQVKGSIEDLLAPKELFLAVDVEADSVTQVARLAGKDVQRDDAVKLEGNLSLGAGSYKADQLKLEVGPNKITGEVTFAPPVQVGGKSALTAYLDLGSLDLERYFVLVDIGGQHQAGGQATEGGEPVTAGGASPGMPGADAAETSPSADVAAKTTDTQPKSGEPKKLFPSDPLPYEVLRQLDADVEITADEIATWNVMYYAVKTHVDLKNGILTVDPFNAAVGQGSFQATAKVDASRSPASVTVDVGMDNGTTRHFGGTYNLNVDLNGSGDSIAQIMAGLNGQIIVDVRDLDLEKSAMTQFGRSLTDSLNPFDKEEEKSELTCGIVGLDIADGIANADDRIVAQLTHVTWFGGGTINLKTEELNLGVQSKPRKGLGINVGGLARLVHVGGTLASPKLQLDPKAVAVTYGHNFLTVATGGLYAVAKGLWDKDQANSDVCFKVLELEEEERKKREAAEAAPAGGAADREREEVEDRLPAFHDLSL